ncbi:MAG: hypothetical protein LBO09_03000 [Candidatus Peribacteria bacterium]|jgi:hypothetical protein|nr:hypothetical protein [Candidatus Peribacteria bacterium]
MKRWEQDIEESIQHASSGFAEANWDLGTEETFAVLDKIEKEIIQKAKKLIDDPQIFQRFCKKRINPLFDIYTRRTTRKSLALGLLQGALYPKDRARDDFQTIEENVEATLRSSLEPQIQSDELSQQYTTYLSARKIFFRQKGKSLLRERFKDLHNPEITSEQLYNDMRKFLGFIRQETIYWLHDPHGEKAPQPQWYLEYHPEVEQQLYPELQIPYKKFFQKVEKIRPQILQRLLQEWGSKNMEGRVKRMVEDQLLQQF